MNAFVKTNNGTFPNVNFYLAWEAFNTLGYSVTCFEERDIPNLDITPETPVFAGTKIFHDIVVNKLGIDYKPFNCYPTSLSRYYGRTITRSTLGEERRKYNTNPVSKFVKPVLPKQFIGQVWTSILQLIPLANIPDEAEVWVCEPMPILSEHRVYVQDGEILGVKHYWGEWWRTPDPFFVERVVKSYTDSPIAYGVDIAVADSMGRSFVVEANDACNLGNYGLDSIHYGEMIISRWYEIMGNKKVTEGLGEQMVAEMRKMSSEEETLRQVSQVNAIYENKKS